MKCLYKKVSVWAEKILLPAFLEVGEKVALENLISRETLL